eukprot:1188231-Prorocentrum_minimum.AAC.2
MLLTPILYSVEKWEKVGNWTRAEKRGRVSGVLSASLPLLAQEDPVTAKSRTAACGAHAVRMGLPKGCSKPPRP